MSKLPRANSMERINFEHSYFCKITNGRIGTMSSQKNKALAKEISTILFKNAITVLILCIPVWLVIVSIAVFLPEKGFSIPEWILPICSLIIAISMTVLGHCLNSKRFVELKYSMDETSKNIITQRNCAFNRLSTCGKIWGIEGYTRVVYSRVNAGAGKNVKRHSASLSYKKLPSYIKCDYTDNCYQLKIGFEKYIFLPDVIILTKWFTASVLSYDNIHIDVETTNFVETECRPRDAEFLYNTWQYVNNNGTPDRRFNNNHQIPVYLYAEIHIRSNTGLNLFLMTSNVTKTTDFKKAFEAERISESEHDTQDYCIHNTADENNNRTATIFSVLKLCASIILVCLFILSIIKLFNTNIDNTNKTEIEFTYLENSDGSITITGYNGSETNVVIPNKIKNKPVTQIKQAAFKKNSTITEITIPENIVSIESHAFWNCSSLAKVTLSEGLEIIHPYAFMGCRKLTNLSIPTTVYQIGEHAFDGCENLFTSENAIIYVDDWAITAETYNIAEVTLKTSTVGIADRAFESCMNFKHVKIPSTVKSIGEWAFSNTRIESVEFEDNSQLTIIHVVAFSQCKELKHIEIPANVVKIQFAFSDCINLTSVTFEENSKLEVIGLQAFQGCTSLKTFVIPQKVQIIENRAFADCSSLDTLCFYGSEAEWNNIAMKSNLTQIVHFYSPVEPISQGNYWHYGENKEILYWGSTEN